MTEQNTLWESVVPTPSEYGQPPMRAAVEPEPEPMPPPPELYHESRVEEYKGLVRKALKGTMPTPPHLDEVEDDGYLRAIATMAAAGASVANGGGGVFGETYEPLYSFTVTTATDAAHSHPHAGTNISGRFDKRYAYRVTFDGDEYILPSQLACMDYDSGTNFYTFEYIGNISLYRASMDGSLNQPFDVPFLVAADDEENDGTYSVHVYTKVAGEHTVKVEKMVLDFEKILPALIYGGMYVPFQTTNKSSTYEVFSVGVNRFNGSAKYGFAAGYNNVVSANSGMALGQRNEVSGGHAAIAIGYANKASGEYAHANGWRTTASGQASYSEGYNTVSSAAGTHAEGVYTIAGKQGAHAEGQAGRAFAYYSHVEGGGTYVDESQPYAHVGGVNNAVSTATGKTITVTQYNEQGEAEGTASRTLGKYAEVIGNGDSDDARSNARTLDWSGNEELAGGLTLGLGTADETTITAAQLKALLALLN